VGEPPTLSGPRISQRLEKFARTLGGKNLEGDPRYKGLLRGMNLPSFGQANNGDEASTALLRVAIVAFGSFYCDSATVPSALTVAYRHTRPFGR
jgi:anaerobic glycerol-3-phosphate dehydrogenase